MVRIFSNRLKRLSQDAHLGRLMRNGGSLLGSNTVSSILEFVQVAVLTRLLLPGAFGDLALVMAFVGLVNQFLDVRVREAVVKFGVQFRSVQDRGRFAALLRLSYLIDIVIGLVTFIVVNLAAPFAASHLLHRPELVDAIQLFSLTSVIGMLKGTNNSILLVRGKFKWMSVYGATMPALTLVTVAAAAWWGQQLYAVLTALVFMELVRVVVSTVLARKALAGECSVNDIMHSRFAALGEVRREVLRMLMHTNFMGYFRMVNTKVDVMIVGAFCPSAEVGYYKLARALASVIGRISDPFFSAILPQLSALYATRHIPEYKKLLRRSTLIMGSIMFCAAAGTALLSHWVVLLISGPTYAPAASLLAVGIWGFAIGGAFFWTWPSAVSLGRADFGTKVGLVVVVVQLGLALWLVPRYGAMGNMLALVASYAVGQPLAAILVINQLRRDARLSAAFAVEPQSST